MKVLVLSCATGGGHKKCAKYIKEECDLNNIECYEEDYFAILNRKDYASKLYLKSLGKKGGAFKYVYKIGELYNKTPFTSPVYMVSSLHKEALYNYIQENNFDLVITTHLFPALCLTAINKEEKKVNFIFVSTDYECEPFNNEVHADYIVVPKDMEKRYEEKNIENKLLPFGIPISSNFVNNAKNVKDKYVKDKEKLILLTLGSMGYGDPIEAILSLCNLENVKIIVVCATNKELYEQLKELNNDKIIPLGFVDNINDLVLSADLVISKPGGLFSTEIATLNRPFIQMFPIPGVETYNMKFFNSRHMSEVCLEESDLLSKATLLLNNKDAIEQMLLMQRKYIEKYSAAKLIEFIKKEY